MESVDPDSLALRLPVDFVVRGTSASIQTSNKRTRDAWIAKVREAAKRWFSEFACEPPCNQEYAGGLEQRLDDEAEPVIAQREALVLQ